MRHLIILTLLLLANITAPTVSAASRPAPMEPAPTPSPYIFRHISTRQGLPENYMGSVFRLPDGRMAMRADLIIWDGVRFYRYPAPEDALYPLPNGVMNYNQYVDRHNRLWMKKRGELRVFDLDHSRYITGIDSLFRSIGFDNKVKGIEIDSEGSYWISTEGIVWKYDEGCGKRKIAPLHPGVEVISATRSKDVRWAWILFSDGNLMKWDCEADIMSQTYSILEGLVKSGEHGIIKPLNDGVIAVMTDNNVGIFEESTSSWRPILPFNENPATKFTSMEIDSEGKIWIGRPKRGVYICNPVTGETTRHEDFPLFSGKSIRHDVECINLDPETGGIWLALHDNGLLYYNPHIPHSSYTPLSNLGTVKENEGICTLIKLHDGSVMIGTSTGRYVIKEKNGRAERLHDLTEGSVCRVLFEDSRHRVWTGTFDKGLLVTDNGGTSRVVYAQTDYHDLVNHNNIRSVAEDREGKIWVAVQGGLGVLDNHSLEYLPVPGSQKIYQDFGLINAMAQAPDGTMTLACEKGTVCYEQKTGEFKCIGDEIVRKPGFENPGRIWCNSITYDSEGNLWLGTHTGVYTLSPDGRVSRFGIPEGLALPVSNIACDDKGHLWISTANSLYLTELVTDNGTDSLGRIRMVDYLGNTSIPENEQLSHLAIADNNDILSVTRKGILRLTPMADSLAGSSGNHRQPLFNALRISGVEIAQGETWHDRVIYEKTLGYAPEVTLRYNENNLTIGFVNLDFDNPGAATFRYRLEGFDTGWADIKFNTLQGELVYNNLLPGDYRLRVCSIDRNGDIGPESVFTIHITRPWWQTWWFKMLVFLTLAAGIWFGFRRMARIRKQREEAETLRKEEVRKKELDDMKVRFFTNVSHELRTPLTMIITPLQTIIDKMTPENPLRPRLINVHQNARNLLTQVNQLLDFRRMEVGAEKFTPSPCNLSDLIRVVSAPFAEAACERNIEFRLDIPSNRVVVNGDKPKLTRILSNVFSNAVKYTPSGGRVKVTLSESEDPKKAVVTVTDSGIGVPPEELERIFERFYRATNASDIPEANSSSGVGLHMVREYVKMHDGDVKAGNNPDGGTTFTISIPIRENRGDKIQESVGPSAVETVNRPLILLAEDNDEFRSFLAGELSEHYKVIEAEDGEKALSRIRSKNPTVVISDVMMPLMDGIELTKAIKSDLNISHIPVILLTAHANEADETSGYQAGADAYISKPFNMQQLLTRIANLIEQQRGRWEKFNRTLEVNPAEISISSPDEDFISKAVAIVEKNIDDENLTVDRLTQELSVSKATLFRKLQGMTGQTPNNFIKKIRLKRAACLLRSSTLSIGEIAAHTGFTRPRYFSQMFKEEYGVLPSAYRSSNNDAHPESGEGPGPHDMPQ